jgi:hypothetical protein
MRDRAAGSGSLKPHGDEAARETRRAPQRFERDDGPHRVADETQDWRALRGRELDDDVGESVEGEVPKRRAEAGAWKVERDRAIPVLQRRGEGGKEMDATAEAVEAHQRRSLSTLLDVDTTAAENHLAAVRPRHPVTLRP